MSFSDPLVLPPVSPDGVTSVSDTSSFFTPSNSGFCVMVGIPFSSPRLLFGASLDTGSCSSDAAIGESLPSPVPLTPSPSDSEPEAELLSDGERDGDFFSCFSSFFLFFFFFLAACLLCFLDFVSPSVSTRSVITSLLHSSFSTAWSPAAAASLALALVVLTGFGGGGGSTSDSAPDSELLSFSPFLFLFFFLLLCFLCFLFFLWGASFPSLAFMSSFSGASSSPEGMSTAHSIVPMPHVL